ncbi:CDP-glycerol glycerophosphotransferase family protein [Schinkia azotoformans]|uniref:CDP-glycerol glycerophosphotransferase family protein n=1 Tax=Schinkia azotoformans TaxID=1454 RepID=UPI002DBD84AB|nr:CDP-glycerol glycerophosphotransferase family protein [Schinkia azotoformans]MEC1714848.1 CDP-glycerol glycerophosphotransferase family protein [Schinkia azotoformans]
MGNVKRRIDYILKHNIFIQKIYKYVMSLFFRSLGVFIRTDEKLILFNAHGWKYNDSPRTIFEYMASNGKYSDYKFVWALDNPEKYEIPKCVKVKMDTAQYFFTALKAKYWVSCVNIERGLNFKKKTTTYLNTWHGTPLKLVGNAIGVRKDYDFSNIDIFCYAGNYEKEIYKRDFNVGENSLLLSGLPRNDELYKVTNDRILGYKKLLNLPVNKKVILYAPTWRDSLDNGKSYAIKPPIDITYWQKELQDEYILLLRTHAYTNKILGFEFNEFVRDFSQYPEINHLLITADILISDYSATIFDFSILEKPIICFGYDYDEYSSSRGLYINLEQELPNGVTWSQEEVIRKIKMMDYQNECKKTSEFKNKYLESGGAATLKCVQKLIG